MKMMQFAALVLVALWGSAEAQRALPLSSFQYPSAPLLPIAPLASFTQQFPYRRASPEPVAQRRTTTFVSRVDRPTVVRQQYVERVDPCTPTPCGPNTRCEVNSKNIALCKCQDNFVPDGHTINGCKPQCLSDFECPDDYRCELSISKCERLCPLNECGIDALCIPRNHKSVCKCPDGYSGNPSVSCSRREAPAADPVYKDPCSPNPCGVNADCSSDGQRAVCKCLQRYEGDPLGGCARSECITSDDCPRHLACQGRRCIDPCQIPMICGALTDCDVRNHQPICSCLEGHVGDPFDGCRRFDPEELCRPSPCARNTNCRVQNNRAVCTCIENYIGDPLHEGCRPECVYYSDCRADQDCVKNRCVNPCSQPGACGEGALCDVRNGRAICSCPQHYRGSPSTRCYPECTVHDDCRSYQACHELKCVDPCVGACGTGAQCRVESHKAICSCPKGFTGHPFEECKPFNRDDLCRPNPCGNNADCTPGYDRDGKDRPVCTCRRGYLGNPLHGCIQGECLSPDDCRDTETCYEHKCQTACYINSRSVCGTGADCTMRNHRPVCSCPKGYSGDPLTYCSFAAENRYIIGRSK